MATEDPQIPDAASDIPKYDIRTVQIRITGETPLICQRYNYTNDCQIPPEQLTSEEVFEAALYRLPDGRPSFPAIAFKNAAVDACDGSVGITKVAARQAIHVAGNAVVLEGEPRPHESVVKIGDFTIIRYRAEFKRWATTLTVKYNASILDIGTLLTLFRHAGHVAGVGGARPGMCGSNGVFGAELLAS